MSDPDRRPDASDESGDTSDTAHEASPSDALGGALAGAARRAGLDPTGGDATRDVVWRAMGGWRGILESVLPSLTFLVVYTLTGELLPALLLSVGIAGAFTVARLVMRSPVQAALGGLVATGGAALLALWTGRAEDNFVLGFITNGLYGGGLLVSSLVGYSLIGLAIGFLMGEGTAWRRDRRKRRVFFWLGIAWAALFAARLAVQLPLYAVGDVTALGTAKLAMGLPLFAPMVAVTWLAVRALYPRRGE
ncbi:DUF3159 domain-containing protein [Microbacterium sp. LRZ72]|uniref:DUF3159 domain-containing protein n=1 Tax=Microbacterium sp. LRZ72 TaxID=2942481 RepID=UPI0029B2D090|nr:DUF3159 domain-containing protein [Microbacterium sp. LRZ72]MDX2375344.1 DUF3159 domain-containing protein [Microbacterium sp. LRZ72]